MGGVVVDVIALNNANWSEKGTWYERFVAGNGLTQMKEHKMFKHNGCEIKLDGRRLEPGMRVNVVTLCRSLPSRAGRQHWTEPRSSEWTGQCSRERRGYQRSSRKDRWECRAGSLYQCRTEEQNDNVEWAEHRAHAWDEPWLSCASWLPSESERL